jgi:hypothetical protein
MIIYNGIRYNGKVPFLSFSNDKKQRIEIPIDNVTAERISIYLSKISASSSVSLKFSNDEDSD